MRKIGTDGWRRRVRAFAFMVVGMLGVPALAAPATRPSSRPVSVAGPQAMPQMTAAEQAADTVWSMRAGLNVAALQCQFSPFLMTAGYYNAILRQHSDEFTDAFNTLNRYFIKARGARAGARAFDTYATRANQSFATFDGQYSFCDSAAAIARRALAVRKGAFAAFAGAELPAFRQSLGNAAQFTSLRRLEWASVPDLATLCRKKRDCR